MITRVAVTGGSGATGRTTVAHLVEQGYNVVNLDKVNRTDVPFVELDLRDFAAVTSALEGADAVVHLGSNPRPDLADDPVEGADRFAHNTTATFTVMWAAGHLGIKRVVWASSQQVFGWPWVDVSPEYLPLDGNHPQRPQNGYAMSKVACEHLAGHLAQRFDMTIIGLRLSNIHLTDPSHDASYDKLPAVWQNLEQRRPNLWGYIDARDAARAVELALNADLAGAHNVTIAAADTLTPTSNTELVNRFYPGVPLRPGTGPNEGLHGIDDARRLLGWEPQVSWRDELGYR